MDRRGGSDLDRRRHPVLCCLAQTAFTNKALEDFAAKSVVLPATIEIGRAHV